MVDVLDKAEVESIYISDSCHSGTVLDMQYQYDTGSKQMERKSDSESAESAHSIFLSACREDQLAADRPGYGGAFTAALVSCLRTYGLNITIGKLLDYVDDKTWWQRPGLSASYDLPMDTKFCDLIDGKRNKGESI